MLVVGTSGLVNPAALLCTRFVSPDAFVVEVNPEETVISAQADLVLRGTAAEVLSQVAA
jgi:NAD-dependent deacetylase